MVRDSAPKLLAKYLHDILVEGKSDDDWPATFEVPAGMVWKFREKVACYREAVILMRLMAEEADSDRAGEVRSAFEAIVLGSHISLRGLRKLRGLRAAMGDLGRLVSPEGKPKEFAWARRWFGDIGYDATNPMTCLLLATHWMNAYIYTAKAIRECLDALPPPASSSHTSR